MHRLSIEPQPDDVSCGPTCLHAVYKYYGDSIPLAQVIAEVPSLPSGGTQAVFLACHALQRGYRATLYTYNLQLFDPSWFHDERVSLSRKLKAQRAHKQDPRLHQATEAYLQYLHHGGKVRFKDLTPALLRRYLKRGIPLLTGLSGTYLYGCARERTDAAGYSVFDDIGGVPMGHFVVLTDHDPKRKTVRVADPYKDNPHFNALHYTVGARTLINAIMLGIVSHDANLLVIRPKDGAPC